MANLTPDSGDFYMFKPSGVFTDDSSLESAILKTIASGIRPTSIKNFGSLVSSIPNLDLINDSHGTKGGTPSNMGQLRGYPMPTINMNYVIYTPASAPAQVLSVLRCNPTLNNIVGFDVYISFGVSNDISETHAGVAPTFSYHYDYPTTGAGGDWWKINAGSLTPDSSSIAQNIAGTYTLNYIFTQPTVQENITVYIPTAPRVTLDAYPASVLVDSYETIESGWEYPITALLPYEDATPVYELTDFYKATAGNCSQLAELALPNIWSYSNEVVEGDTLYQTSAMTTPITASFGITNRVGASYPWVSYDWFTVTSGVVGSFNACP